MAVLLAGSLPWGALLAPANLRVGQAVPWAILPMAVYLWFYWTYIGGRRGSPDEAASRRRKLRANPMSPEVWSASLLAGLLGFAALFSFVAVLARVVSLPTPAAPTLLVNGAMFGLLHFPNHPGDVATMLPYYIAVAAVYGGLTWAADSILPALVLHSGGDVWSLGRLWITGRSEWQLSEAPPALVFVTGIDAPFLLSVSVFATLTAVTALAYRGVFRLRAGVRDGAALQDEPGRESVT